jgi:hypothetical protein
MWGNARYLDVPRSLHSATLLPSGRVLVSGGLGNSGTLSGSVVYNPGTNTWNTSRSLARIRSDHTTTRLLSGKVLVVGGLGGGIALSSAELFEETGAQDAWRPVVTGPASLTAGVPAVITGTRFRGVSGGSSGGTSDSPTDFPLVRLWSLATGQTWTLPGTAMSPTSVSITPPDVLHGSYLLSVTVNGLTTGRLVPLAGNTPPVISGMPSDQTVEATSPGGAVVSWTTPTATDHRGGTLPVTCAPASGSAFPVSATTVTCAATDSGGETASVSFTVTVRDTSGPALSVPDDRRVEATGSTGAAVTFTASATDLVDGATAVACSRASGSMFPIGPTVVTCTSTDSRGNTGSATFTVTVTDTAAPTITCPADLTTEATSSAGAVATFSATASDLASTPSIVYSTPAGSTFGLGTTSVSATATDGAGNTASCTFSITVQDTTAPAISCPANVTAEATSASGALVTYADVTTSDAVSTPAVTYSQGSGAAFVVGETTVTAVAKDAANNASSCSFTVTVRDTTPPAVECPDDLVAEAMDANGALVTFPAPTASDLVSPPAVTLSQASMTAFAMGETTVTATVTDAANNTATCSFRVTVQDTTAPALVAPADQAVEATSAAGAIVSYDAAMVSDAVTASPTLVFEPPSGTQLPLGRTTVIVSATDAAENRAVERFTVTVTDTVPPVMTCPANVAVTVTGAGEKLSLPTATATDAVTTAPVITYSLPLEGDYPAGTTLVTATATDEAGNAATCQFSVTVSLPAEKPVEESGCSSAGASVLALVMALVLLGRKARRADGTASVPTEA